MTVTMFGMIVSSLTFSIGLLVSLAKGEITCNGGYTCYEDGNVVWVTGPGTCSQMCANGLTGESPYVCKGNQPVLGDDASFGYVAQGLRFDCNDGGCWGGSTGSDMMWISRSGDTDTRSCYYPSEDEAFYGCESTIGNANCFGTRFDLVCPCEPKEVLAPTPAPTCGLVADPFRPCREGFTCWKGNDDDDSPGVVWVIGGGIWTSCRNTCEAALDQHTDFYVCKSDQTTHASYEEFQPISDGMGFTCRPSGGGCSWTIDGAFWVDPTDRCERTCLSSSTSNEYYDCHASVGNANCFGERYTLACPCHAKPLDEACEWDCPHHSAEIAGWPEHWEDGDSCLERINYWRKKACEDGWPECPPAGLPPMVECTACHQCANTQSEYDRVHGSHASFTRCGERSQGSGGGRTCRDVIDAFVSERDDFGGYCQGHCGPIVSPGCNTFHWGRTQEPNGAGFYHYTLNWGNCAKDQCDAYCGDPTHETCFASGIDTPGCVAGDGDGDGDSDEEVDSDEEEEDTNVDEDVTNDDTFSLALNILQIFIVLLQSIADLLAALN